MPGLCLCLLSLHNAMPGNKRKRDDNPFSALEEAEERPDERPKKKAKRAKQEPGDNLFAALNSLPSSMDDQEQKKNAKRRYLYMCSSLERLREGLWLIKTAFALLRRCAKTTQTPLMSSVEPWRLRGGCDWVFGTSTLSIVVALTAPGRP